jgi:hypothetical protein
LVLLEILDSWENPFSYADPQHVILSEIFRHRDILSTDRAGEEADYACSSASALRRRA